MATSADKDAWRGLGGTLKPQSGADVWVAPTGAWAQWGVQPLHCCQADPSALSACSGR